MKKFILGILIVGMLMGTISPMLAEVDGIYTIMWQKQTDDYKFVSWYNHDNSVQKGPEYTTKMVDLLGQGYIPRGTAIGEYSGGSGQQYGTYDIDVFLKSILQMDGYGDEFLLWRSTPEGMLWSDDEGATWNTWNGGTLELPTELEELDLEGIFQHEDGVIRFRPFFIGWTETGEETPTATIHTINEDGTEATWVFDDYRVLGLVHSQITVEGEEIWETKTVVYELPQGGSGDMTLQPRCYCLELIRKDGSEFPKYAPTSINEYSLEAQKYIKDGKTYIGSPAYFEYMEITKKNHGIVEDAREEARQNKWLATRVTPFVKK